MTTTKRKERRGSQLFLWSFVFYGILRRRVLVSALLLVVYYSTWLRPRGMRQCSRYGRSLRKRHGAKGKRCSYDGCTNGSIKRGFCWRHGARIQKKRCNHDGCANLARRGGVCVTQHGATKKRCSHEGCTNYSHMGGVCKRQCECN